MALYSRREIIEHVCGEEWTRANKSKINMWVKRGKLIQSGNLIDDTNPQNRDWILKQRTSDTDEKPVAKADKAKSAPNPSPKKKEASTEDIAIPEESDQNASYYNLDKQFKKQQVAKLKVDTRIAELKEDKIRGEVIPVELVKNIFTTHTQSIVTSQKDGIEQLLIDFSMEARLNGTQLAKLRGKMVDIINHSVDNAIIMTQKNMKVIVNEFSITRGVGEHD